MQHKSSPSTNIKQQPLTMTSSAQAMVSTQLAQSSFYVSAGGGMSMLKVQKTATVANKPAGGVPTLPDVYTTTGAQKKAFLSLDAGYRWARDSAFLPFYSLGAAYTYYSPSTINGDIQQDSVGLAQWAYQYQLARQTLMLQGKVDLYRWGNLMPFISAAAGYSFNSTRDFQANNAPGTAEPSTVFPAYGDLKKHYFTYAIGTGLDYQLRHNLQLSVSYQYGNAGYAQTANEQKSIPGFFESGTYLKNSLKSNDIGLSLTYFITG